jgi:hypothetical protein
MLIHPGNKYYLRVSLQSVKRNADKFSVFKEAVKLSCLLQATTHHSAVMIARYRRDDTAGLTNVCGFCSNSQSNRRMRFQPSAPPGFVLRVSQIRGCGFILPLTPQHKTPSHPLKEGSTAKWPQASRCLPYVCYVPASILMTHNQSFKNSHRPS